MYPARDSTVRANTAALAQNKNLMIESLAAACFHQSDTRSWLYANKEDRKFYRGLIHQLLVEDGIL